jgi:hypothetical protein
MMEWFLSIFIPSDSTILIAERTYEMVKVLAGSSFPCFVDFRFIIPNINSMEVTQTPKVPLVMIIISNV